MDIVDNYGWWLLALVLIGAEMIAPGYFLLWIGIAAGLMGVVTWIAPTSSLRSISLSTRTPHFETT